MVDCVSAEPFHSLLRDLTKLSARFTGQLRAYNSYPIWRQVSGMSTSFHTMIYLVVPCDDNDDDPIQVSIHRYIPSARYISRMSIGTSVYYMSGLRRVQQFQNRLILKNMTVFGIPTMILDDYYSGQPYWVTAYTREKILGTIMLGPIESPRYRQILWSNYRDLLPPGEQLVSTDLCNIEGECLYYEGQTYETYGVFMDAMYERYTMAVTLPS